MMKYSWIFVLLLILGLLGALLYQTGKVNNLQDVAAWRADTVRVWQDKAGRYLAEKSALQISSSGARQHLKQELEQVQADLGVARNKIASLTRATSTTEGSVHLDKGGDLTFKDDFSSFSLTDAGSYYHLRYSITDSLLITAYYERPKFWKAKQLRVKAISYNPNTRLTGLDHIAIKNKPSRFALSLHAGYGISREGLSPYVGVGVGFDLMRF